MDDGSRAATCDEPHKGGAQRRGERSENITRPAGEQFSDPEGTGLRGSNFVVGFDTTSGDHASRVPVPAGSESCEPARRVMFSRSEEPQRVGKIPRPGRAPPGLPTPIATCSASRRAAFDLAVDASVV